MMDKRKRGIFPCYLAGMAGRNIPDAHRRRELIYMFFACILIFLCGPVCCPSRLRRNHVFIAPATVQNLADETRLGIVLLLKARGELCVRSVRRSPSPSPRSPAIWRCSVRADCCWIVNRVSGSITALSADAGRAAQVIEQALSQQEDVRLMISRLAGGPGCR